MSTQPIVTIPSGSNGAQSSSAVAGSATANTAVAILAAVTQRSFASDEYKVADCDAFEACWGRSGDIRHLRLEASAPGRTVADTARLRA